MLIEIIIGVVALFVLVYFLSRVQMRGWLHEIDDKITKYLPKKDDNSKN
jgi:hypothetical protein